MFRCNVFFDTPTLLCSNKHRCSHKNDESINYTCLRAVQTHNISALKLLLWDKNKSDIVASRRCDEQFEDDDYVLPKVVHHH